MFKKKTKGPEQPEMNVTSASATTPDGFMATIGHLQTQVNRRDLLIIGLVGLCVATVFGWKQADDRFANNVQVGFVQMAPSGETYVKMQNGEDEPEYFQATVEHFLRQAATWRLSKDKRIDYFYGGFSVFLSEGEGNKFQNEFKAADKASAYMACADCPVVEAEYVSHTHLDELDLSSEREKKSKDKKAKNIEYTTLLFYNLKERSKGSNDLLNTERVIMQMRWRLKTKKQIQEDRKNFGDNPIGLEIVGYDIKVDPSFKQNNEPKRSGANQ